MAALVFTEHLRRADLADKVRVSSAGIGPWHAGQPADRRAAKTLADHGYPTEHRAAQVDEDHLSADLLLAMDSGHDEALRDLLDHQGGDVERVRMFRSFDPAAGKDLNVPDPYYGHRDGFAEVMEMIEAACPALLTWVRERVTP
ncbi:protein-tyrosine phosphatase [Herbihabitans rhizosphaerae]|uniref:protein-tyrosine-phosphatase n=2 Tax=Herbihabitans rhizosphaerae TaxID=1872711 RepID=A0A4Q7L4N6_9PSEU|nr:protein-tyrosine phosphatase [Herbihabitans rhizosphaerae]